jgi:hypothetical protein
MEEKKKKFLQKRIIITLILCMKEKKIPKCLYQNCILTDYLKNTIYNEIDNEFIAKNVIFHDCRFNEKILQFNIYK